MKHIFVALAGFVISSACIAEIDCANATASDAMIYCSKKSLQDAETAFKTALDRLSSATWIPKKSTSELVALYKRSSSLSKTVCSSIFTSGRLRDLYINDCISMQLDKLTESMNYYVCTQQDADGCR